MPTSTQTCVISSGNHDQISAVKDRLQELGIAVHESHAQMADPSRDLWGLTVPGDARTVEQVKQVVAEMKEPGLRCRVFEVSVKPGGAPADWYMEMPERLAGTDVKVTVSMTVDIGAKWTFLGEMVALVEDLGAVIRDYDAAERQPIDRARQFWAIVTVPVDTVGEAVRLVEERLMSFAGAKRWSVEPVGAH